MIICIGRESGSGGHEIGKKLAEKLSIPFYDQELIVQVMEKWEKMDKNILQKLDEKKANPWLHTISYEFDDVDLRGLTTNEIVFRIQKKVILDFAKKGDCIFVGRCADFILKEAEIDRVSLFITAPFEDRVVRKKSQLNLSEKEVINFVKKTDKQRKNYYNYYTGGNWGKTANYDFCINSYGKNSEYIAEMLSEILLKIK